ncbi:hypothetical protein FKW77_004933 [Venturia effusa]|uniref:Uncharacterized protein n=1 Tax=Venturia effusa TaxID=50376 RepID=A0A517LLD8_9PEZI|nr:hypothetical protein FKW77_004933 [Venturia effusa]
MDCSARNRRNFNMIKEAANLGVCKECYKREKSPRNRNNTRNQKTHVCATHIETYANFVRQRALRCVFYRRQIKYHKSVAKAKRWTIQKPGTRTMKHTGLYWRHPRGELYAEPHCVCGRPARHKRIGWQDTPEYNRKNKDLNKDLVRSCAVCTSIPGDVAPSNPRPMTVETDANGVHIGPGLLIEPKRIPTGPVLNAGGDYGTEGWVRRERVVAPPAQPENGLTTANPAPGVTAAAPPPTAGNTLPVASQAPGGTAAAPPPTTGNTLPVATQAPTVANMAVGPGTVTNSVSPLYQIRDAYRRLHGHVIQENNADRYQDLSENRGEQTSRLEAYNLLTTGLPTRVEARLAALLVAQNRVVTAGIEHVDAVNELAAFTQEMGDDELRERTERRDAAVQDLADAERVLQGFDGDWTRVAPAEVVTRGHLRVRHFVDDKQAHFWRGKQ